MPVHAGFAAAVTIRESVLNIAAAAAYANGDSGHRFGGPLPGTQIPASVSLFLGPPVISLEGSTGLLVVQMETWGRINITLDGINRRVQIFAELALTLRPVFTAGEELEFTPPADEIKIRQWSPTIITPNVPHPVISYIRGEAFKARLEESFVLAIVAGQIKLPKIDVSFLGPLVRKTTSVESRIRNNALLIGLNIAESGTNLTGTINALEDFAGEYGLAGIVNPQAVELFLQDLHDQMVEKAQDSGATLSRFTAEIRPGYILVRGRASKTGGALNFSFRAVPYMYHTRPGKYFGYLRKPVKVKSRTYPALGFRAEGVDVDQDRSWWVILFGEVIFGLLSSGLTVLYVESLFRNASKVLAANVEGRTFADPPARVIRNAPPLGGIKLRIALERFDISMDGIYTGISFQQQSSTSKIAGPQVIPDEYTHHKLPYKFQLPSSVFEDDSLLRIQWTLENRLNGTILADADTLAAGHLRFTLMPNDFPGVREFGIRVRLYRKNEFLVTEISNVVLGVSIRGPLQPNAYIRWHTSVKTPQVDFDTANDNWVYKGESKVNRWSEWHRLDRPCKAVNAPNRYRYRTEIVDRLPFSLEKLDIMSEGLCQYCFYGGPTGINP